MFQMAMRVKRAFDTGPEHSACLILIGKNYNSCGHQSQSLITATRTSELEPDCLIVQVLSAVW